MNTRTIKYLSFLFAFIIALNILATPIMAAAEKAVNDYIKELIVYYKEYQENAKTDIMRILDDMAKINKEKAAVWTQIMDYWSYVNTDMTVNTGTIDKNLPQDNSMAIVILGYSLNSDGTMKNELIGRLQTGLALAKAYPNAYVVVTGGQRTNGVTEGGAMGQWLLNNGLDSTRLIIEDKAADTVGNAKNTYDILNKQYPQVTSFVMVTSDYHIPRGCILFYSKCLLAAYESGGKPLNLISNAGYYTGTNGYESISLQASGISSVAGVSISGVEIELSQLAQLDIKLNKPHQKGNPLDISASATYHNGYTRDITDLITISGFDAAQGNEQTISISYTENGITVKGSMPLSKTKATFFSTQYLQNLVNEANTLQSGKYTAESFEKFQNALTDAKTVLAKSSPTLTEVGNAYTSLSAAMDSLVLLTNIAYKMNVTVNCNSSEASKVTDGTISTSNYWSSLNGNTNVPSANAELIIDLDGLYDVEAVTVYPYWGGQRIYKYKLLGSTDGENWFSIGENSSDEYVTSNGITHNMQAKTAYVKLVGVSTKVVGRADINNIHICEIQVFGSEANNIALNKTVTSSGSDTSASSSATATSDKINDSDRSTYWDAGKYTDSPFATITLDGVYQLDKINVIAYWMRTDNRYYNYSVYTSIDGINYTKVGNKNDKTVETVYGSNFTFTDTVLYAKYIKIVGQYNSANSAFHINEVRAYGTKVDYDQILAKQSLESALSKLPAYNKDDYTKESFAAYEAAVSQAQKALDSATAEELIKAQENLENAINSLTEIVYDVSYVGLQTGKNSIRFIGYITQNAFDTYNGFDLKITFTDAAGKTSSYTCLTSTVYTELKSKNGVAVSVAAKTSSGTVSLNQNDNNSAYLFCHSITDLAKGTYSVSITPIAYEGSETTTFKTASYANITVASNGTVSVTR